MAKGDRLRTFVSLQSRSFRRVCRLALSGLLGGFATRPGAVRARSQSPPRRDTLSPGRARIRSKAVRLALWLAGCEVAIARADAPANSLAYAFFKRLKMRSSSAWLPHSITIWLRLRPYLMAIGVLKVSTSVSSSSLSQTGRPVLAF